MFKKALVSVASVMVLAACATSPTAHSYKNDYDYVTQEDIRPMVDESKGVYSSDVVVSDKTKAVRKDFMNAVGDRVMFDFDSANLSADAQKVLTGIANYILQSGEVDGITVEGHCDERGTREYNLALGDRRAVAVKRFLVGLGVDAAKINTISYGKERPVDNGHNERAWAKNRRSVIVLN
ncbi:MAG: peptidoglycan-associated lipoprotein Pal [Proteobacteria bacterium]|nr:peptidoglycan-associated lipoprotein Pal [Pseudomonadota bacterium]